MNRFLKKQWEDTEVPQEALLRARNRAWQELQQPAAAPARRVRWAHALAFASALVLAVLLWVRPVEAPEPELTLSDLPLNSRTVDPVVGRKAELAPRPAPRRAARTPPSPLEPVTQDERLVVNFRLPESGIRMIWIMDPNFRLTGGTE